VSLRSSFDLEQQPFIVTEFNMATPFSIFIKETQHAGISVG
jgi:hypothetical protein